MRPSQTIQQSSTREQARKLVKTGISEDQAIAVVEIIGEQVHTTVSLAIVDMATKRDIADMATKRDIADMATKRDIADMVTKSDIADMVTKSDIADMATKRDIADMATKSDLAALEAKLEAKMATKDDIADMATKSDIADMATKSDLAALEARLEAKMVTKEDFHQEIEKVIDKYDLIGMGKDIASMRAILRFQAAIITLALSGFVFFAWDNVAKAFL